MRRTLLLLIALLATLGLVAGCGTSGGEEVAPTTTAATAATTDTTDDTTDTTEVDAGGEGDDGTTSDATVAELEALLPTAEEVGPDYVVDEAADDTASEDGTDEQFREACPGLESLAFLNSTDDDADTAVANFRTEDDREVEVRLDPASEDFTEENLDALVAAFDECGELTIEDDELQSSFTINITAERDGSRGDFGLRLDMAVSVDLFGIPITLDFAGQAFSVDGVAVFVSATSGMEETETDFTPVPLDEEILSDLSDLMENRLNDR